MKLTLPSRLLAGLLTAAALSVGGIAPAEAGNGTSLGHGVKCRFVLIPGTTNSYQQVCSRGP